MPLSLFSHSPKTYLIDNVAQHGKFGHTFGGTFEQFDLQLQNTDSKLHLIYRIDLSDPEIQIQVPNVEFLPLLYNFGQSLECSYLAEAKRVLNSMFENAI